jgi:antitoxin component of RelBE/YafQ-DinJ toxin-antitoxin module
MITARLSTELELQAAAVAKDVHLTVSDLVRIGLIRVLDEYRESGTIEVRPSKTEKQEVPA